MAISLEKEPNQVIFEEGIGLRKIVLNRPKKLNCLSYDMMSQILKKVKLFEHDLSANLVILKANGKSFCVGGDVIAFVGISTFGHWSFVAGYYRTQLNLNYLLATYNKPLVALINGVVMGEGVGLSILSRFRIVTEKTIFAMPEASIGLFPDVGASYFLSRLSGFLGEYLGLTGTKLNGKSMVACGLATQFVLSKDLAMLENALDVIAVSKDCNSSTISEIVDKFSQRVDVKKDPIISRLDMINKCFSGETVEDIISSLAKASTHKQEKWILDAIKSMNMASPTSLKVFLRSIREGRGQKLDSCLNREFKIVCHIAKREIGDDFVEGVRSMLIDKDKNPRWVPSNLAEVSKDLVNKFFLDLDDEEWKPLNLPSRSNVNASHSTVLSRL